MTHEPELTEAVDLCTPDGAALNPAARGWSRRPLHRCNLDGAFGRNKRWDYWAILASDLIISTVYSNVDYVGLADVYWCDLATGERGGGATGARDGEGFVLPEVPGTAPLVIAHEHFELAFTDDSTGTRLFAHWTERDGRAGNLDVLVARPPDHESLNVVIPWSDDTFNFTSKHQARPATGELRVGDRAWTIGDDGDAWGVLDVGRGRWPSEIVWNWGGGAGRAGDHVVGLQFGAKWTHGTGFTENGVLVDGRLSKIGNELQWDYTWDEPMRPWRVHDPGGQVDVTLTPRFDKHSESVGRKRGSETHQVFGTWAGRLVTDDGVAVEFEGLQGFAEEARQRW
ncbi:MAG TPA: DUF2804 domain-containing protein [Acidimicrobiales bacterium]|nr:DUF2804 domain-containing protein [Acidimicrobiales bacterium]